MSMAWRREVPDAVLSEDLTLISCDSKYLQLYFVKLQTSHRRGNSLSLETRNIWKKGKPLHTPLGQRMAQLFNFQSEWLLDLPLISKVLQPGKGLETLWAFPPLALKTSTVGPFTSVEAGIRLKSAEPKVPALDSHRAVWFSAGDAWAAAVLDHRVHRPQWSVNSLRNPF